MRNSTLDPPLRSRFQCLVAEPAAGVTDRLERLLGHTQGGQVAGLELELANIGDRLEKLIVHADASVKAKLPPLPERALPSILATFEAKSSSNPPSAMAMEMSGVDVVDATKPGTAAAAVTALPMPAPSPSALSEVLARFYPVKLFGLEPEVREVVEATILASYNSPATSPLELASTPPSAAATPSSYELPDWIVETKETKDVLDAAAASHGVGRDLCIVGERGGGKSTVAKMLAHRLGYSTNEMRTIYLFRDMTSRDLLQQR